MYCDVMGTFEHVLNEIAAIAPINSTNLFNYL